MTQNRRIAFTTAAYAAIVCLLGWRAGLHTWAREDQGSLSETLQIALQSSAPLPGPLYTADLVLYALFGAGALFVVLRLAVALVRGAAVALQQLRRGTPLTLGQRGQAMTEVVVSFPILLITTLILMQLALMYQARNVVTYAAFSAARAAIVWIPIRTDTEAPNQIQIEGGEKMEKIRQAAAMACVPISPKATGVLDALPSVTTTLNDAFSTFSSIMGGLGMGGEYLDNALQRYGYSVAATEVLLYRASESGFQEVSGTASWTYPTNAEDVGVRVRHRYYLQIPVINRLIGDTWSIVDMGPVSLDLPGKYTYIRSVAVLPLEGTTGNPPITGFWD